MVMYTSSEESERVLSNIEERRV